MDKSDITRYLKGILQQQKSEVNFGTFRETGRSSLLREGLGTRANSVWKQSEFVVAFFDEESVANPSEDFITGWTTLTQRKFEQFLILEHPKGTWTVYDKQGNNIGGIEVVEKVAHQTKERMGKSNPNSTNSSISLKYRQYITAIKSKPFLLLAGISGTGKSRIVRELARACWQPGSEEFKAQKPGNFEMVQVKPNWHDSSELIGYVSRIDGERFIAGDFLKFIAKAWENEDIPYFLCLDEMNLAPVEQYFAEYLSVIESRKTDGNKVTTDPILKKSSTDWYFQLTAELTENEEVRQRFNTEGITIPKNLIVIGTVNMDETTFSFSRKVLDRAMTIEMNEVLLYSGLTSKYEAIGKLGQDELIGTKVEGVDVYADYKEVCDKVIAFLQAVNDKLEGKPFKVAYRTRNEFLLYVVNNLPYNKDNDGNEIPQELVIARALDEITCMKVLSRIEGDEAKVPESWLKGLQETIKKLLNEQVENIVFTEEKVTDENNIDENGNTRVQSISLAKLKEMIDRLASGYTSFWS